MAKTLTPDINAIQTGNFCSILGKNLDFSYNSLCHCCITLNAAERPKICDYNGGKFPFKEYLDSIYKYTEQNSRGIGACLGCDYLRNGKTHPKFDYFSYISINNFNKCNLNCVYCNVENAEWRKKIIQKPYNVLPALVELYDSNYIREQTLVDWGGGEPTLYDYFDEVVSFCVEKKLKQNINTSGLLYSKALENALAKDFVSVRVSVDSGTSETYKKVKGVDCYNLVWKNIENYSKIKPVEIKYITTPENNDTKDIEGFVNKCLDVGIRKVIIAPEFNLYYSSGETEVLKDRILLSAKDLYGQAIKNNLSVELFFWSEQDKLKIKDNYKQI